MLTVNPSVYVELVTFCISEWLAASNFVIFFYFLVSFHKAVETVMQMWCKVQQHYISVGSEHNVVLVIRFFLCEASTRFFASVFHSGE